ncbi:EAL domain-containing protein [Noviherbaspirillum sp. UKPF54]|uniref:bifunctional diguanylate cyclase/phosphodiesterase n=1 Tax=Noviherbaspirillum sp. UKPF54 TaxID=2601898 RepID=UPI00143D706F|nr:EAL domain-containing protein [Noviherbaspirillum sp. UKPF54]
MPHLPADTGPEEPIARPRAALSQKIGGIFLVLLLLGVANVIVVHTLLAEFNGVAATVNIAGKLRFLSQKIALNASNALHGWSAGKGIAESDIVDYEAALETLAQGKQVFGHSIKPLTAQQHTELGAIRRDWSGYRAYIESLLAGAATGNASAVQLAEITEGSARMLAGAERLLQSLTLDAQQRQEQALNTMYLLLLVDAAGLVGVFMLIRMRIVYPLRKLARRSRELAEGNYHVRIGYRADDEMGQLADAFNYAAQRIGALVGKLELEHQSLSQAESMFRGLAENSVVGVYVLQDGCFRFVNAKMAGMFGYERDEMLETVGVYDLVPEGDRNLVESNMQKRLRGDTQGVRYERRARRKDGDIFDVEVFGSVMQLDDRPATIGIMHDITERKQAEASARMATLVYQNSAEAMTITDAEGIVIDINPAFTRITGYERDEVVGQRISILRSGRQDRAFYDAMWHAIASTGHWQGEIWNRRKNGDVYAEWLTISTVYNPNDTVFRRIALFSDITYKKKTDDLVWHQANFDSLTGLPNRLMFRDRLEQEIRKSHRASLPMALIFLDLDRFKEVNDTLGHAVGDKLLQQAAQRLSGCVRESDTVARLGGDEFTIILGELNQPNNVERIVQDVLRNMAEPFVLGDEVAYVSASLGITFYPDDATEIEDLLKNADQAMYAAKNLGRNRFHYFTPCMQQEAQARRRLISDLRLALAERQFRVQYQPIVDLSTGAISKAEALIRWQHPARGLVSPAEFIPIAEETGLIVEIGDWVFREVVWQLSRWRARYPQLVVSLNTSPVQYRNSGIDHLGWFKHLHDLGVPANAISVEITEGLLLDTSAAITNQILRFREAGAGVALDDFGTGYSSMSYLSKLDIDYLKIDRSFILDLTPESENVALYEAMIVMAHKLGIKVIAEGVETEEQFRILQAVGCDYAQGYLFSRPVPPEEFEALLRSAPPSMLN